MSDFAPPPVTEDRLLGGRLRLFQPRRGYRAAIDPVLLAAAVPARAGDRVLDLGCGVGAAALCLAMRVAGVAVEGLEVQPELVALARRNAAANGLDGRLALFEGDLAHPSADLKGASFDHVMMNPPFAEEGQGTPPPDTGKAIAHVEGRADLEAWIGRALRFLKPKGRLVAIHRADRLDAVLAALATKAGGIEIIPLWPGGGKAAKRVIVRARKGVRTPLALKPGLVLHEADGRYTAEAESILRDGAAIP